VKIIKRVAAARRIYDCGKAIKRVKVEAEKHLTAAARSIGRIFGSRPRSARAEERSGASTIRNRSEVSVAPAGRDVDWGQTIQEMCLDGVAILKRGRKGQRVLTSAENTQPYDTLYWRCDGTTF
jgi:hypothetical protein